MCEESHLSTRSLREDPSFFLRVYSCMSLLPLLQLSAAVSTWLPPLHGISTLTNRANKSQFPEKLIGMALQCQMLLLGAPAAAQSPKIGIQAGDSRTWAGSNPAFCSKSTPAPVPRPSTTLSLRIAAEAGSTACSSAQVAGEGGTASACLTAGALL